MRGINPGKLSHKIEVWHYRKTGESNELGADEIQEELLLTRWAKLESRTGSLLTGRVADTRLSKTTHKFTVRYTNAIKPDCWILYDNRRFTIDYINDPDFSKHWLEIFVQEVSG